MKILIVDDNRDAANGLLELLSQLGFASVACYGGRDGLEKIKTDSYGVVLLDIEMPDMSGLEVARAARKSAPSPPILVALTGWKHPEAGDEICKAGFDYFLRKPINLSLLASLLEAVCFQSTGIKHPG